MVRVIAVWAVILMIGVATAVAGTRSAQRELTYANQRDANAVIGLGVVLAVVGVVGSA